METTLAGQWHAPLFNGATPGTSVGISLGKHSVVSIGLGMHFGDLAYEGANFDSLGVTIPVELKVYLRSPAVQKVLPILRFGAAYGYSTIDQVYGDNWLNADGSWSEHGVEAIAASGIQYMLFPSFGVSTQVEVHYGKSFTRKSEGDAPDWSSHELGLGWRAGLVFRF